MKKKYRLIGLLALLFLFLFGIFPFIREKWEPQLSASLLRDSSPALLLEQFLATKKKEGDFLRSTLSNNNFPDLKTKYEKIAGAISFLHDAEKWTVVTEVSVKESDNGFLVDVLAADTGDSLHRWYGFFAGNTKGETEEIVWGETATATIVSQKRGQITLKNNGPYPWFFEDKWQNEITGEEIFLEEEAGKQKVESGEKGIFRLSENTPFLIKNESRGFFVLMAPDS